MDEDVAADRDKGGGIEVEGAIEVPPCRHEGGDVGLG